jgi:hypothetical protein
VGAAEESVTPRDVGGDGEAVTVAVGPEVGLADMAEAAARERLKAETRKQKLESRN